MPPLVVAALVLFPAIVYFLLAPLVLQRTLLRRFDRDLFTPSYWQSIQEMLPFYRYRRAMIYLAVLGFPPLQRHRFPNYDFTPGNNTALRVASWLQMLAAGLMFLGAVYGLYLRRFGK